MLMMRCLLSVCLCFCSIHGDNMDVHCDPHIKCKPCLPASRGPSCHSVIQLKLYSSHFVCNISWSTIIVEGRCINSTYTWVPATCLVTVPYNVSYVYFCLCFHSIHGDNREVQCDPYICKPACLPAIRAPSCMMLNLRASSSEAV